MKRIFQSPSWSKLLSKRTLSALAGLIAFASALVTLWGPITSWLWARDFNVYILHPHSSSGEGLWDEFDEGFDTVLARGGARLDSSPLQVGGYELSFSRKTWLEEEELVQQVGSINSDDRTLAVVIAANSHYTRIILDNLSQAGRLPILLATATKGSLVREYDREGIQRPARGVFRLVAANNLQAIRLASTILTPAFKTCDSDLDPASTSVALLREEAENAAFSQDLAQELRTLLNKAQAVRLIVDAAVDNNITVPRELVDLKPDFLVYIGPLRRAVTFQDQVREMQVASGRRNCLPSLVVPDAGVISESGGRVNGASTGGRASTSFLATLPLGGQDEVRYGESVGFERLGIDSAELVFEAARSVLQRGNGRLNRKSLIKELAQREFVGEASDYEFRDGENIRADFHVWEFSDAGWKHSRYCKSEEHTSFREQVSPSYDAVAVGTSRVNSKGEALVIGAKPFTEQFILADLAVEVLNRTGIPARRGAVSLNGIRDLLLLKRIDGYWEYTGAVLHRQYNQSGLRGEKAIRALRRLDEGQIVWFTPLQMNNTFVLAASEQFAEENELTTLSELADFIRGGGTARLCSYSGFYEIEDGLPGLERHYGFSWPKDGLVTMPAAILYDRFKQGCDIMVVFSTDARFSATRTRVLEDDESFFPEYLPSFVLRDDVYRRLEVRSPTKLEAVMSLLDCIRQNLDESDMISMNSRVELAGQSPEEVAEAFLANHCL